MMKVKEFFEQYKQYVDSVTSETARVDDVFAKHYQELSELLHGNYARLDHAVTGLTGEAGEVADVWKKVKYMGLEYNAETREIAKLCTFMYTPVAISWVSYYKQQFRL